MQEPMVTSLRELRELRGLTQQEVSERMGYSTAISYLKLETGVSRINTKHIQALGEIFKVSPSFLFDLLMQEAERKAYNQALLEQEEGE